MNEAEFDGVAKKLKEVIIPSYVQAKGSEPSEVICKDHKIEILLKEEIPKVLLKGDRNDVSC